MEKEENVYGEFAEPNGAEAREACGNRQGGDTSDLGKFKDVDALLKAYGCLQAEFTRRSQRLKQLEREARKDTLREANAGDGGRGVEKLRENARTRKANAEEFDAFVLDLERAGAEEKAEPERQQPDNSGETAGAGMRITASAKEEGRHMENGETEGLAAVAAEETESVSAENGSSEENGENGLSVGSSRERSSLPPEELYALASREEGVRLRIVGEYLSSLRKNGAPLTVSGVGVPVAPPLKAKTIDEAGNMALRWFKRDGK